jgi:hypothetical protein
MPEAEAANEALGKVKTLAKQIAAAKDAERRPLNDRLKAISAQYEPAEKLLNEAETTLKFALSDFRNAETKRLAEQKRLADEAAAKERAKLEEAARLDRERAQAKAQALIDAGKPERADAILAQAESSAAAKESVAAMVAAPSKPTAAPVFKGASFRKVWKGRVVSLEKFLAFLAQSDVYKAEEFVDVNQTALNRVATSLHERMGRAIPGTEAYEDESVGARAR